jgi:hypothetical protein
MAFFFKGFAFLAKVLAVLLISPVFILTACRDPAIPPAFRLDLPALPPAWEAVLGPPHWQIEWFTPDGSLRSREGPAGALPEVELAAEWASPVLAYPFWPERGLLPGAMYPAGAIAPFDTDGPSLRLSWEAGPAARFYRALASARQAEAVSAGGLTAAAGKRRPDRFDWPRFRELLRNGDIPPEIRADPWLADWDAIAAHTVQSGFDRRRIQPRPREPVSLDIPWPGPWAASSPFAEVRLWKAGETVIVDAAEEAETLVSAEGALRYSRAGVVRIPRSGSYSIEAVPKLQFWNSDLRFNRKSGL